MIKKKIICKVQIFSGMNQHGYSLRSRLASCTTVALGPTLALAQLYGYPMTVVVVWGIGPQGGVCPLLRRPLVRSVAILQHGWWQLLPTLPAICSEPGISCATQHPPSVGPMSPALIDRHQLWEAVQQPARTRKELSGSRRRPVRGGREPGALAW